MQSMKTDMPAPQARLNSIALLALAILLVLSAGLISAAGYKLRSPAAAGTVISQATLEEKYGLRVNLIAVTAAGGFVDVRLKIVDGEKAKLLVSDQKNFPSLRVHKTILFAPPKISSQSIHFDNDGIMFIMYVNSSNLVKAGTPVQILFGEQALEPMLAK